ncbi:unnamed protein product [Mytilus edulis]|uniref:Nephrocystin 3-like N-terminal domain-containing protein n=1 Tax=Mytilus edulis TaxID=6550 RepID=A0A8S3SBK9_MYTED|nr:unnamed protein product [Mytilus edulis]
MEESRGVLLVADPGYGKSAAMSNIILGKHKLTQINVIYHLCISSDAKFQRADSFILNFVQNLYCKYPSYEKMLEKKGIFLSLRNNEIKTSCKFDPVYCFDELIVEPLSMFHPPEGERLVFLIDALDECNTIDLHDTLNRKELLEISTYHRERKKKNKSFEIGFQDMVTTFDQQYLHKDIIKLKPFLQDWMMSLSTKHPCKVDKKKGHAAISRFMLSSIDTNKANLSHDFIVELFMHMQRSDKKIDMDMLKLLRTYVDNPICGHNLYGVQYEPCHSVLDMFASVVDSFRLMKKMISFSKTSNRTLSAINALLMNNTNSFIAILEKKVR